MTRKPAKRHYGYGIVGKSGTPWWLEHATSSRRAGLETLVYRLNGEGAKDSDSPYRVVRLFYMSRRR